MEWLGPVLTGGCAAAAIKLIESMAIWRLNRKAKLTDDRTAEVEDMVQTVHTLKTAQRVILHDRIKYLGRSFIYDGSR